MSIDHITVVLERLVQVHQSLLQLSLTKTELLKKGAIEEVQRILKNEQKHIQAIDKLEKDRLKAVDQWSAKFGLTDDQKNVTTLLEKVEDDRERDQLEQVSTELAKVLVDLKAQENLNQELTEQSLQFVQMNLDLLSPTIEQVNYGNKRNQDDPQSKRSTFDTKA